MLVVVVVVAIVVAAAAVVVVVVVIFVVVGGSEIRNYRIQFFKLCIVMQCFEVIILYNIN